MQPGNLVRVNRATIGIPSGALALVMEWDYFSAGQGTKVWRVQFVGENQRLLSRRYLEGDLEIVNASR